jgi:hypothetical protein
MAHVADVARSVDFYRLLGFEARNILSEPGGQAYFAWIDNGCAHLMLARASGPVNAPEQAILFYLYSSNIAAYRADLEARGVKIGPVSYPFYMPEGEFRIEDPDGYVLLVGQSTEVVL